MILQYFPEELLALQEEIALHPDLQLRMAGQPDKDIYVQLSEVAAHCGILLEGMYSRDDILGLAKVLVNKLQSKRTILVLPMLS